MTFSESERSLPCTQHPVPGSIPWATWIQSMPFLRSTSILSSLQTTVVTTRRPCLEHPIDWAIWRKCVTWKLNAKTMHIVRYFLLHFVQWIILWGVCTQISLHLVYMYIYTPVSEKTCSVATVHNLNKYGFVSFAISSPYTICLYALIFTWHRHFV
jgi:hypothetical protein